MKTLYESILGSTKSGKHNLVQNWCEKYKPFGGNYKINSNSEIERTKKDIKTKLYLDFIDYTELPPYIQFADDKEMSIIIGKEEYIPKKGSGVIAKEITSFRGLPKITKTISIFTNGRFLPDLEMSTGYAAIYAPYVKSFGKLVFNIIPGIFTSADAEFRIRDFGYGVKTWPKTLIVNNARLISMVNAADMGDNFSKLLNRKAPMNKYVNIYEYPITDDGLKNIEDFFGNSVNLKTVQTIKYTQNSELVKDDNKWYRCKNRD